MSDTGLREDLPFFHNSLSRELFDKLLQDGKVTENTHAIANDVKGSEILIDTQDGRRAIAKCIKQEQDLTVSFDDKRWEIEYVLVNELPPEETNSSVGS